MIRATRKSTERTSPKFRVWVSDCATSCPRSPIDLRTKRARRVARVMMPNPPSWMSARMTPCPKGVQNVAVSTVMSPVTHTAETAVNRAGIRVSAASGAWEAGSISSPAPRRITARNARGTDRTGWSSARLAVPSFFGLVAGYSPRPARKGLGGLDRPLLMRDRAVNVAPPRLRPRRSGCPVAGPPCSMPRRALRRWRGQRPG